MDVATLKEQARVLEQEGKLREALGIYRKILTQLEGTPNLLRELPLYVKSGDLLLRLENPKAALAMYDRAAKLYAAYGSSKSVLAICGKVLRLAPERTTVYLRYARIMLERGHVGAARAVLEVYAEVAGLAKAQEALRGFAPRTDEEARPMLEMLLEQAERAAYPHPEPDEEPAAGDAAEEEPTAARSAAPPPPPRPAPPRPAAAAPPPDAGLILRADAMPAAAEPPAAAREAERPAPDEEEVPKQAEGPAVPGIILGVEAPEQPLPPAAALEVPKRPEPPPVRPPVAAAEPPPPAVEPRAVEPVPPPRRSAAPRAEPGPARATAQRVPFSGGHVVAAESRRKPSKLPLIGGVAAVLVVAAVALVLTGVVPLGAGGGEEVALPSDTFVEAQAGPLVAPADTGAGGDTARADTGGPVQVPGDLVTAPPTAALPLESLTPGIAEPEPSVEQPAAAPAPRPTAIIEGLPILRLEEIAVAGGRVAYRIQQTLPSGDLVTLVLVPHDEDVSQMTQPTAMALAGDSAMGRVRFGGFDIQARAPVSPDSVRALLGRLVAGPVAP